MSRIIKKHAFLAIFFALFLSCAAIAIGQQTASPAPASTAPAPTAASPAEATPSPGPNAVAIKSIPELDETQSGTFLPDPDYINRFAQADPSLRKIDERQAETDFTTFDPVAALNMELKSSKQSIDALRIQLQDESFYKNNPPLIPKRLQNVPVPQDRRNF